ncbi:hypothetical protein D1872_36300 [compost metagenome]
MEYAVSSMSAAHTIGNVSAFIMEMVKGFYPPGFFNVTNITDTIAYRYLNGMDDSNNIHQKVGNPKLTIQPRIDITEGDVFLKGTFLTSRITDNYMEVDEGNLQPFFEDKERGNYIKFLMNRMSINFDVTMMFDTQMEQINQGFFLRNRVRQDHPFFVNTALESNISLAIVRLLAKEKGIDTKDRQAILTYLNDHANLPVTYKLKNSTGNDEFFRFHPEQLDITFTNLSLGSGNRRGQVADSWPLTFTISVEFNTPALYYYYTENRQIFDEFQGDIITDQGKSVIPFFTIPNLFDVQLPDGWEMYRHPMFKVSSQDQSDSLSLEGLLEDRMIEVIQYHKEHNIPIANAIGVTILKNNAKLPPEDYVLDYDLFQVTILKGDMDATYRLIMYINTRYINNLVATIHEINKEK